jgi:hypothetical protein
MIPRSTLSLTVRKAEINRGTLQSISILQYRTYLCIQRITNDLKREYNRQFQTIENEHVEPPSISISHKIQVL